MSGTAPQSILARLLHWPRYIRWASFALFIACLAFLTFGLLYQGPTQKVIQSVGGDFFDPFNDGSPTQKFNSLVHLILRDPYPKDLYLGPRDLRQDEFHQVYNEQLRDEEILQIDLSTLGHLRIVDLSGPNVTDRGFAHIVGNRLVHNASCRRAKVTDAGLAAIVENKNLIHLYVSGNAITDRGMSSLAQMSSLSSVSLHDTSVTNQGLQ